MSWSVEFILSRDEDGKAVLTVGNEFGAPEGDYMVSGHTLASEKDWGESVGVTTPIGGMSSTIMNPRMRRSAGLKDDSQKLNP